MLLELYLNRPQWFNPLFALFAFSLSLVFAWWFTRRLYNKHRKWSISAPLLSFAVLVVLTTHLWAPFIWITIYDSLNRHYEWLIGTLLVIWPLILLLFLLVFFIQFFFTKAVYKKLVRKQQEQEWQQQNRGFVEQ